MTTPAISPNFGAMNTARILVEQSPDQVWPWLFRRRAWMPHFDRFEPVDGPQGAVGERLRVHSREGDQAAVRMEETLALQAPQRLVLRLALPDDRATMSFAEWRLTPTATGTEVEFNVYWLDVPPDDADGPAIELLRADYVSQTQRSIEQTLARFRAAVLAN
jgi:hypothetical protein